VIPIIEIINGMINNGDNGIFLLSISVNSNAKHNATEDPNINITLPIV
jgi:hypothetical protein